MIGECRNAEMRDRLPDVLHDRLPAAERADVHAHLNQCSECREELALLGRIRAAAGNVTVDASRIVAALPAYRAPSLWSRAARSPIMRIAAVIVLVIGGSMLVSDDVPSTGDLASVSPETAVVTTTPLSPATIGATSQVASRTRQAPAELAVGEAFEDLSDTELQALLKAMESLEARTSSEPEVVIPAVSRGGA